MNFTNIYINQTFVFMKNLYNSRPNKSSMYGGAMDGYIALKSDSIAGAQRHVNHIVIFKSVEHMRQVCEATF